MKEARKTRLHKTWFLTNENLERLNYSRRKQISDCLWLRKPTEAAHSGVLRGNEDVGLHVCFDGYIIVLVKIPSNCKLKLKKRGKYNSISWGIKKQETQENWNTYLKKFWSPSKIITDKEHINYYGLNFPVIQMIKGQVWHKEGHTRKDDCKKNIKKVIVISI